ncbi:orotidine 5-phosphate decarboxylase pyrG-penicillium chrysogenum [Cercophora newfieldiana]|uniref:Orotidine 5'-phosphate decarboxylase n=1 Tax=Cercophora newfieldiana TaxID=92897 RepID=A0AA40CKU2_9PEZI|nr:orotidine 5-phosphate decarboxylase pyrG-penicillium chrysogenum [Cercophora newfieldiana]
MTSLSNVSFHKRAMGNLHPIAKRLFEIADGKQSNLAVSADVTDSKSLLDLADNLGPYIVVLKTHADLVSDFDDRTIRGLKALAEKHNFLLFEDRKFVDIGNTVQKQYHGGPLRISEWADIVNFSILGGDGIAEALNQTVTAPEFPFPNQRAFLVLAEMTSEGSLATGSYTKSCVEVARKYPRSVIGFVATRALGEGTVGGEDFVVFATAINMESKGDDLGQQHRTPQVAVERGADFIIAGRGLYGSEDPVEAAKLYRAEGWSAYLRRIQA